MMIKVRYVSSRLSISDEHVIIGGEGYSKGTDMRVIQAAVEKEGIAKMVSYVATSYDEKVGALPTNSADRKAVPLQRGCLDYFPAALAEVAKLSLAGNEKHNPGEELHHARGKSSDHADCIARHQIERGEIDPEDGFLHDVKVAWRALAQLQEALEARGAPLARGARLPGAQGPIPLHRSHKWEDTKCIVDGCDIARAGKSKYCGSVAHKYDGN